MGKVGKTFTLDMKVLAWIESAAKKAREKESAFVNSILRRAKDNPRPGSVGSAAYLMILRVKLVTL